MSSAAKNYGLTESNVWTLKFILFCQIRNAPAQRVGQELSSGSDRAPGRASLQTPAFLKLREMGLISWDVEKHSDHKKPWKTVTHCHNFRLTEAGKKVVFEIRREETKA